MLANPYKCLACGHSPLERTADAYRCGGCRREYPIRSGVPLFLRDLRPTPSGFEVPRESAERICDFYGREKSEERLAALREIFRWDHSLGDLSLTAENNCFFDRVGLPAVRKRPSLAARAAGLAVNDEVRYEVVSHLILTALPAGELLTRNVRLVNKGRSVLSSGGDRPVFLAYRWRRANGKQVAGPGESTRLPIDLLPGRSLAVPLRLRTPFEPGAYLLDVRLAQDLVGWLEVGGLTVGVEVLPGAGRLPAHWAQRPSPESRDYAKDHRRGVERVADEVRRHAGSARRLLEVGGCNQPQTRGMAEEVYSLDVDVQTLQVGQLMAPAPGLHFLAADVSDPPFADATFDGVVIFSALHHFPDPVAALTKLRRLLRAGGFLAVMCEPSGELNANGPIDPVLYRELEQGINEQVFTLAEFHSFFLRAGLYADWAEIEGGSLKAILYADGPAAPSVAPQRPAVLPRWWRLVQSARRRLRSLWRAA